MSQEDKKTENPLNANFVSTPKLPQRLSPVPFIKLFRYASKLDKALLALGIIFTGGSATCRPLNMLIFGILTQNVIGYASKTAYGNELSEEAAEKLLQQFINSVTNFVIFNSLIGFAMLVFTYLSVMIFNYTALRQVYKIRTLYFKSVLNQDIVWHDVNQTGDFASRMSEDLNKFEDGIGEKVALFLHSMLTSVACIILALVRGWELALICLASLPFTLISLAVVSKITSKIAKEELDAYGSAGAIAEEVLSNIKTVLAFGGEAKEIDRYEKELRFARNNNIKRSLLSGIGFGLLWFFNYAIYALAFWYGVNLIVEEIDIPNDQKVYSAGTMVTVFFSVMEGSSNFGMAAPYIETFSISRAAAAKVFSVIDNMPIINQSKNKGKKLDHIKGKIVFSDVHFNYPTRLDVKVLQGVSFTIEPGQTTALVGSSGSGKSTCVQLIQRFYDSIRGTITIDDVNIKDLDLTWLRSKFGVVGQEPVLFGTTILENIRMGNRSANRDDVEKAAKRANAHDFIVALPQGYDTPIAGAQLSGGQKQRIAIARALVREPTVLLLDEATSALDTHSEAKVQAALDAASKGCTTIIVAHRLSTIRGANKIIVFSHGKIVEEGTYQELMVKKGHFYGLVLSQASQPNTETEESNEANEDDQYEPKEDSVTKEEDVDDFNQINYGENRKIKINSSSFWEVFYMNKPEWCQIFLGCFTSIITGCALPIFAVLFGDILGILSNPEKEFIRSQISTYCIYFMIMGLVTGPAVFTQIYMFGIAGERLVLRLRKQMFAAMLKHEMGWFDAKENEVGNLCARLSSETSSVQGATGQRIGTILQSLATLFLGVSLSLYFEWRLGLVTLAFAPFVLIATFFQKRLQSARDSHGGTSLVTSTKIAVEAVSNIRTVVSLGNEEVFHQLYVAELMPYYKVARKGIHVRAIVLALARSLLDFAFSACIYYGGILIRDDNLHYSNVFKVAQSLIFGTVSIADALAFTPNFQKGLTAAAKILHLLNREPKIKDSPYTSSEFWVNGDIEFSKVEFRYPTRPLVKVLNGLDLTIFNGKTVALVGSSGCGKSTIIQLLERFYDPNRGQLAVDGNNVKHVKLQKLRSNLGIVSQEPNLFDRTIAENIAYGDNGRAVSRDEIIEASKKANIHNFVVSLPMGYETRLGEKGTQLSGGQKQRIAIARALIRNPKVLLLDEATSALDNESEKIVQQALDHARQGRTCITIAHRLTTVQDADVICVLNAGRITEMGSHAELIRKRGLYEKLYMLQVTPPR